MNFNKPYFPALLVLVFLFGSLFSCNWNQRPTERVTEANPAIPETGMLRIAVEDLPEEALETKRLTFLGAGDNIVYYGTVRDAMSQAVANGRPYNFKPIYSDISSMIANTDISFINQETLMCGEGFDLSYYPMFNGPQDMGLDLVDLGFDIVNISNNHMVDRGADGLEKTISFWKKQPVLMIGGYENQADFDTIRFYEKDGIKIAMLSYTYGTNGLTLPSSSPLVIPYLEDSVILNQIAKAKESSDLVFASIHWGDENNFQPNESQKHIAQLMADHGVDAIIGHHPHVVQPVTWVDGKDGNRMLCVYSLGNLAAEMAADINMVGGLITFDIVQIGYQKPTLENVVFVPTVYDFTTSFYKNHVYLLENYTDSQASHHGIGAYGVTTSRQKLMGYVTDTIAPEFLPAYLHEKKKGNG